MRKALVLVMVAALAVSSTGASDAARKRRTKRGSFSAHGVPFPELTSGCLGGIEGLNKHSQPLKIPFTGTIKATMLRFDGDWDLFITDREGRVYSASTESQLTGAAPEEKVSLPVVEGQQVMLVPCNWLGGLTAEVEWTLTGS